MVEITNNLLTEAYQKGWKVLAILPYPHPEDSYMVKCVIENQKNEFVSYIYNRGFNLGYYFDNPIDAARHMNER